MVKCKALTGSAVKGLIDVFCLRAFLAVFISSSPLDDESVANQRRDISMSLRRQSVGWCDTTYWGCVPKETPTTLTDLHQISWITVIRRICSDEQVPDQNKQCDLAYSFFLIQIISATIATMCGSCVVSRHIARHRGL